jgi:diphosphomevalonate decarboxylase
MSEACSIAHPNVALSKYWGKREGSGNFPAVPSLSVTLAGLETRGRGRGA